MRSLEETEEGTCKKNAKEQKEKYVKPYLITKGRILS